jgi:hypothetical protein
MSENEVGKKIKQIKAIETRMRILRCIRTEHYNKIEMLTKIINDLDVRLNKLCDEK